VEGLFQDRSQIVEASEGWKVDGRSSLAGLQQIGPLKTESIECTVKSKKDGLIFLKPRVIFLDEEGAQWQRAIQPKVIVTSPILRFLANAFTLDYESRGLAPSICGWRTLMEIATSLGIPRSHVYGDTRYGHIFGKQLETLLESSLVESRVFLGERGRGGSITKARVAYDNADVKTYINNLATDSWKQPIPRSYTNQRILQAGHSCTFKK
jgi:hypothetical protein